MSVFEANPWGVTFAVTAEKIVEDLQRWNWGTKTDPISVATLVLDMIAEQTMAEIDTDGTITMGLFEFDMPLRVPLSRLVHDWIDDRKSGDGKIHGDEDRENARQLARLLEDLAVAMRAALLQ